MISFYEQSERAPSPDVLIRLARFFHVSCDYLLGIEARQTLDVSGLDQEDIALLQATANHLRKKYKA